MSFSIECDQEIENKRDWAILFSHARESENAIKKVSAIALKSVFSKNSSQCYPSS